MFFNKLRRLRPETSVFLAAAAIAVSAACGGDAGPSDNIPTNPTGGTGGTGGPGGVQSGSPTGGGTTGGTTPGGTTPGGTPGGTTPGGTTPGGTPGGTTPGGTPGGTTPGGTPGGTTDGGATPGGTTDAGVTDGGAAGGTTGGGAWMPPNPSKVKGTATTAKCISTQAKTADKCGSYYCGVAQDILAPEIDPNKPCGGDPAYACEGTLTKIVTDCATKAGTMIFLSTEEQTAMANACIKADPGVKEHKVTDQCIQCFMDAATCCKNNAACLSACVLLFDTQAKCDQAQMAAGCIKPTFACSGLPDPF